jgi:hypothetical protein
MRRLKARLFEKITLDQFVIDACSKNLNRKAMIYNI